MSMHSALRRAIEKGNLDAVRTALDHGALIEEADMHGDPGLPMRIACFKGHADIVRELIKRGADIHAPNAQGAGGPIRMASRGQHSHIVELLLAHGAEVPEDVQLPNANSGERRKRGERRRRDIGPPSDIRERADGPRCQAAPPKRARLYGRSPCAGQNWCARRSRLECA